MPLSSRDIKDALLVPSGEPIIFTDAVIFQSNVSFSELYNTPIGGTTPSSTINTLNTSRIALSASTPITVTTLQNGAEGQLIVFLGDGNTTIENNTTIKTNTGADKLLLVNRVYVFYFFSGVWYEH